MPTRSQGFTVKDSPSSTLLPISKDFIKLDTVISAMVFSFARSQTRRGLYLFTANCRISLAALPAAPRPLPPRSIMTTKA